MGGGGLVRRLGKPLYDFEGLRAFKARMQPHAWDRVYLAWPPGRGPVLAVYDALVAFARGGLVRFGVRSLLGRPLLLVWLTAVALVPWTVMLALPLTAPRDATLTLLEVLLYNLPRARGLGDGLVMGVAVLAPSVAAALLFWTRGHPTLQLK